MRDWYAKIRVKILYYLAKLLEVRPFLRIDPNQYCPACGHRSGKIIAVPLKSADESGSKVGIGHRCEVCKFEFLEPTVTIIKSHMMGVLSEEELALEEMKSDKRTKLIKTHSVKVGVR